MITPSGIRPGAVRIRQGRIAAIRAAAPAGSRRVSARGAYVAPGFIDLHVWGEPATLAARLPREGTTAFCAAIGPEPLEQLLAHVSARPGKAQARAGARWLGWHLEGPWLNPARAGALPARWMRPPRLAEVRRIVTAARGSVRLVTVAPERPGTNAAIRWLRRRGVVVSLGHSIADEPATRRAVDAGAAAVTHVFNGMPLLHHRQPGLLSTAVTDPRLMTMVIADGVHVGVEALRLLALAKSPARIALVTDSIRSAGWEVRKRRGAFYTAAGVLAGSDLTMAQAVRNAVRGGWADLAGAVRMAGANPAALLGLGRRFGTLEIGKQADLVLLDRRLRVVMTLVEGRTVFQRT
ncbi:MAG: amidohydrolase family protein [Candidatus Omnitrophica bacterium]|nr:amidohydrolase family protein [Candidatus Omnitrophota bacterium]